MPGGAYAVNISGRTNWVKWSKNRHRVYAVEGPDVIEWRKDFIGENVAAADAPRDATVTLVEAGAGETTVTIPDTNGGELLITTDAAENDGANIQWTAEGFWFGSTTVYAGMHIRCRMNDVTQSDLLAGLCITDTDLLGGMTDGLYFRKVDAAATVSAVAEKDSNETAAASTHTLVVDTYTDFYMLFDNRSGTPVIYAYANDVLLGTITGANIPDNELLRPSVHVLTGEANACTGGFDLLYFWQIGRAA